MIVAVLDDQKTQTRRAIKPQPRDPFTGTDLRRGDRPDSLPPCPYGGPGDRLWVREAWRVGEDGIPIGEDRECVHYRADADESAGGPWRPSIHMPRWASRLTLEIVSVRPERVQEISDADVRAEGVTAESVRALWEGATRARQREMALAVPVPINSMGALSLWCAAWILINGRESWDRNDWLWAIEFRRVPR